MFAATATSTSLLIYIAWILCLSLIIILWRAVLTLSGARRSNSFSASGEDISAAFQRLCRTHANCYEHFPIFGGLLLFALATGQSALTDSLACYWLAARLAQSLIHLFSTRVMAVNLRFTFFLIQLLIAAYWLYLFATH